jgi:large subunit ribosomal protein L25
MSERYTITAEPRTVVGKKVKQLRREGVIPAIIYGQGEPVNIQLERKALRRLLRDASTTNLIDVDVNGDVRTVLARDIQQHVFRRDIMHVDFMEVNLKVAISSEININLVGTTSSDLIGMGSVVLASQTIVIEALPEDLISEIEIDASLVDSPDTIIYAEDLPLPQEISLVTEPDTVVARFEYTQAEISDEIEEVDVEAVEIVGEGEEDAAAEDDAI